MSALARNAAAGLRRALMAGGAAGRGSLAALQQQQGEGGLGGGQLSQLSADEPPSSAANQCASYIMSHEAIAASQSRLHSLPAGAGRPVLAAARSIVAAQLHTSALASAAEAATQPIMDNVSKRAFHESLTIALHQWLDQRRVAPELRQTLA